MSRDGGWAAFDADNTYHYLNNIPFADHGALLDPPTADVTARCVSMLAQLGETLGRNESRLPVELTPSSPLRKRMGVGSAVGGSTIFTALGRPCARSASRGLAHGRNPSAAPSIGSQAFKNRVTVAGARESDSYKLDYRGFVRAPSTASQTAWALLGLMAVGEVDHPAVAAGIAYLAATQSDDGFWPEAFHTATGFPRVFYLRYHGYAKFFPLWALARYRNLRRGNSRSVAFGM